MASILILGATSDIARALARIFAGDGAELILAARDANRLTPDIADLTARGAKNARVVACDVLDIAQHRAFIEGLGVLPDIVISVVGLLGNQSASEQDTALAKTILDTNFTALALLLGEFAGRMEARGSGMIVGVSSVAGDRGRATNYIYGSAKAGFTAFLSGLRNRLAQKNVHVLTVKPGFVDTRMTEGMDLPAALTATPEQAARAIHRAIAARRNTIYVLPVWQLIMLVIRHIPEAVFKKMRI